ncbi:hypothetical protein ACFPT7_23980 [Acidicapsa dinghuensis]|uniref:O-antigen ligase domain-containing protein n=1 Tax=Acidicapsa dinghuensis TaxID=2218256 RepID=A0ABW1EM82_9BACT|nr:hypothetical protein [Acidicapsa dinghuensis]
MNDAYDSPSYRVLVLFEVILFLLVLADGLLPQMQMFLLGGQVLVGSVLVKPILLIGLVIGCLYRPQLNISSLPMISWLLCIGFLVAEIAYLIIACDISLIDILKSYNSYYLLLLAGPAAVEFRNMVSEKTISRSVIGLFLVCAIIGIAQHVLNKPLLYTESSNGAFQVQSWDFFGEVRAFSLFSSGLNFGLFCSLCGALGVALLRNSPLKGSLLWVLAAIACYSTLTRVCYVVFACSSASAFVLTFGKNKRRGLWHPALYCALGISTLLYGLNSIATGNTGDLGSSISLIDRINEWTYYTDLITHSTLSHRLLGFGIFQSDKLTQLTPMAIDNLLLGLVLHIGMLGLLLFGVLMTKMWLYLRHKAITDRQPFVIAASSMWAALPCAGLFNLDLAPFGVAFALVILCRTGNGYDYFIDMKPHR